MLAFLFCTRQPSESLGTEGNVVHYGYIENFIEQLGEKYNIRDIAFDRWGAVQMVQNLEGMCFKVVPFGQGFKEMSPPTKELMKLTLEKKLAHGGHPVLRWMWTTSISAPIQRATSKQIKRNPLRKSTARRRHPT